jgi:hypothetical protein
MNTEMYLVGVSRLKYKEKSLYVRYLISKLSYEKDGLTEEEQTNLWILLDLMLENDYCVPNFSNLQIVSIQDEILRKGKLNLLRQGQQFWNVSNVIRQIILPPHEYFGLKFSKHGEKFRCIRMKYVISEKLRYPEKPYIGVGYKDKGKASKNKEWLKANQTYYENQLLRISVSKFDILTDLDYLRANVEALEGQKVLL